MVVGGAFGVDLGLFYAQPCTQLGAGEGLAARREENALYVGLSDLTIVLLPLSLL